MYYGQHGEDKRIEYWLNKIGICSKRCIDIGCADGIKGSNTKYFEDNGWESICIDPIIEHCFLANRSRKIVFPLAISTDVGIKNFTIFNIGTNSIMTSISSLVPDERLIDKYKNIINNTHTIKVACMPLRNLIPTEWENNNIDFVSIDTEGTELDVLKSIFDPVHGPSIPDINLLVVENNFDDKEISEYLEKYGYEKVERLAVNDFYILKEKLGK